MRRIFELWHRLTPRQKLIAGFALSWFFTFSLDRGADWIWGFAPTWPPFVIAMSILRDYILNGYVAAFIAGALIVGFWSNIAKHLTNIAVILFLLSIPTVLGLLMVFSGPLYEYFASRDDPRLFTPPDSMQYDSKGKQRDFTEKEPNELRETFDKHTTVVAKASLKDELDKYIAITGKVDDVITVYENQLEVSLKQFSGKTTLQFGQDWKQQLETITKGDTVFAVCEFRVIGSYSLELGACELVKMPATSAP